jgi:hypothetical protein
MAPRSLHSYASIASCYGTVRCVQYFALSPVTSLYRSKAFLLSTFVRRTLLYFAAVWVPIGSADTVYYLLEHTREMQNIIEKCAVVLQRREPH